MHRTNFTVQARIVRAVMRTGDESDDIHIERKRYDVETRPKTIPASPALLSNILVVIFSFIFVSYVECKDRKKFLPLRSCD